MCCICIYIIRSERDYMFWRWEEPVTMGTVTSVVYGTHVICCVRCAEGFDSFVWLL